CPAPPQPSLPRTRDGSFSRLHCWCVSSVGYHQGKRVAEYIVNTPGTPERLEISYFEGGRPAAKKRLADCIYQLG
ncbi:hypothetical protein, partial [Bacteroides caecimuris]|uniref:hypothetical protein n=1 Tax=Bacteroides caecimuris TaxID=1796613 RepID=UPI0025742894